LDSSSKYLEAESLDELFEKTRKISNPA
jgi:hypothetical protein